MLLYVSLATAPESTVHLGTWWDALVGGGPVMIPLALCSVVLVALAIDRTLRLRSSRLGTRASADALVAAAREGGPARALDVAGTRPTVLTRIFRPTFEQWAEDRHALEKASEDSGSRELRGLISLLRPFTVIAVSAPLLGLLGTVIGIIIAFRDIALSDAMGKPEALAVGIAQALITTASGLVIAIPAQIVYYWLRSRIDRFRHVVEETGEQILAVHAGRPIRAAAIPSTPSLSAPQAAPAAAT